MNFDFREPIIFTLKSEMCLWVGWEQIHKEAHVSERGKRKKIQWSHSVSS